MLSPEAMAFQSPINGLLSYIMSAEHYLPLVPDETALAWLKNGYESGKHIIVSCTQKWLFKIDAKVTFIKSNCKEGMLLMRITDQNLVQRVIGKEAYLENDEAYYWRGHKVSKIRLVKTEQSEEENEE